MSSEEDFIRAQTMSKLESVKKEYEKASSTEEKSTILLNMLLLHMGSKPEPFDKNKHQGLLELGFTEKHISILKLEIDKRQ
jgi:hypothetical protein